MNKQIVWLRRDLRLEDNSALLKAAQFEESIQLLFIFDTSILGELPKSDARVQFIHKRLDEMNAQLAPFNSSIRVEYGAVKDVWDRILQEGSIQRVLFNKDFEPYALQRDQSIIELFKAYSVECSNFLDHVNFEPNHILKNDGSPYTVYTPYKNKWLKAFETVGLKTIEERIDFNYLKTIHELPSLHQIGFESSEVKVAPFSFEDLSQYADKRDFPKEDIGSKLGPHLRFGTISIRKVLKEAQTHDVFLSELIWREFFTQILYHFPYVVTENFRSKYNGIQWRNNEKEFELWKNGQTGYPIVDAGMRELNATGYMHNRVRMVCASFLVKHLLIDWKWGEAYFAEKLLDYELASNNGNWQWAAGTGCDAAPYFRVFNPITQQQKFDKNMVYIRKWVPEIFDPSYAKPMVDHPSARDRVLKEYKRALGEL